MAVEGWIWQLKSDTRAQLGGAYRKSSKQVARVPAALKAAGTAARAAFTEAQAEENEIEAKEEAVLAPSNGR